MNRDKMIEEAKFTLKYWLEEQADLFEKQGDGAPSHDDKKRLMRDAIAYFERQVGRAKHALKEAKKELDNINVFLMSINACPWEADLILQALEI